MTDTSESAEDTPAAEEAKSDDAATGEIEPAKKKSFKEKFSEFVAEYGAIGLVTWFGILGITVVGFAIAFQFGLDIGRDADEPPPTGGLFESGAVWAAAYLASQAVKPLRIIATFALTPILARVWKRMRGQDVTEETAAQEPAKASSAASDDKA